MLTREQTMTDEEAEKIVNLAFENQYGFSSVQEIEVTTDGGFTTRLRFARQASDLNKILMRWHGQLCSRHCSLTLTMTLTMT